jgi:flagellar protein FlgJ
MAKLTKAQFIATLLPHVLQARKEGSPLLPSVRLAQNLLETGGVIHAWNNLGGIKVGSGKPNQWWSGAWVRKGTWEVVNGGKVDTTANFRAYKSIFDFYRDQDQLFNLSRYARVRSSKTPEEQCRMLQACGYATDPKYADKLLATIRTYGLNKYDAPAVPEPTKEDEDVLKLSVNEKTMLVSALNKLAAAGVIGKEWAENAEKDQLTVSQLTWLNTIIMARK